LSNLSSNHGALVDGSISAVLTCHRWNPIQQDIAQWPRRAAVQCYRPRWQRELESPWLGDWLGGRIIDHKVHPAPARQQGRRELLLLPVDPHTDGRIRCRPKHRHASAQGAGSQRFHHAGAPVPRFRSPAIQPLLP